MDSSGLGKGPVRNFCKHGYVFYVNHNRALIVKMV